MEKKNADIADSSTKKKDIQLSIHKNSPTTSIEEYFQVDEFRGNSNIKIPIFTTKSRELTPELTLEYSSNADNGYMGLGFDIKLEGIFRDSSLGIPRYQDKEDSFCSVGDGKLLLIEEYEQDGWKISSYSPRVIKNFKKLEYMRRTDPSGKEQSYWKSVDSEGTTCYFGTEENSQVFDEKNVRNIYGWRIAKEIDRFGNCIIYSYEKDSGCSYIKRIRYGNYIDSAQVQRFAFELNFDYGQDEQIRKEQQIRKDQIHTYRSGYEITTRWLLRKIQMIHHLDSRDQVVRETVFNYEGNVISLLKEVSVIGYQIDKQGNIESLKEPPITFRYNSFDIDKATFHQITSANDSLHYTKQDATYRLLDLYGEGIEGILFWDDNGVWYHEPLGNGQYRQAVCVSEYPIDLQREKGDYEFLSLSGDGRYDLKVTKPYRSGFYKQEGMSWLPFQAFESYPNEANQLNFGYVDTQGDHLPHLMTVNEKGIKYYPAAKEKGYGNPIEQEKPVDFPADMKISTPEEQVLFLDMFGDGILHTVRVRNGLVECWPNLGYGRFGEKISIANAPYLENGFDARKIRFADLRGFGAVDYLYFKESSFLIYFNQGGNYFDEPIEIELPFGVADVDTIDFGNLLGNGNSCIFLSKVNTEGSHYYYDCTANKKPYLLNKIENHMGFRMEVDYVSHVKQYLEDKTRGKQWKTALQIPINVVSKTICYDEISKNSHTVEYRYQDGKYDALEHELVGFCYIEKKEYTNLNYMSYEASIANQSLLTKHWYASGLIEKRNIAQDEYYQGKAKIVYEQTKDSNITNRKDNHQRGLRGKCVHEEQYICYEKDLQIEEEIIAMTHYQYGNLQAAKATDESRASYYAYEIQKVEYVLEKSEEQPKVTQRLVLEIDSLGKVCRQCEIYYPMNRQEKVRVSYREMDSAYDWLDGQKTGFIIQETQYEIGGIVGETPILYDEVDKKVGVALSQPIPYGMTLSYTELQSMVIQKKKLFYWKTNGQEAEDFGKVMLPALLHHEEEAIYPEEFLNKVAQLSIEAEEISQLTGYRVKDGYYYRVGNVMQYGDARQYYQLIGEESKHIAKQADHYRKIQYEYDAYTLGLVCIREYVGENSSENVTYGIIDYQNMQYAQVQDKNSIITQARYNPLGKIRVSSKYGWSESSYQGNINLDSYQIMYEKKEDILAEPERFLQGATCYYFDDIWAFETAGKAVSHIEIQNPNLLEEQSFAIGCTVSYLNGLQQEIQKNTLSEGEWTADGYVSYLEKDKPIYKFAPYATTTYEMSLPDQAQTIPFLYEYDAKKRLVRNQIPMGYSDKKEPIFVEKRFEYDAWRTKEYNENSTLISSSYYQYIVNIDKEHLSVEQQDILEGLEKGLQHQDTVSIQVKDAMDNIILQQQDETVNAYCRFDMKNQVIWLADARRSESEQGNLRIIYDMQGNKIVTDSCDAKCQKTLYDSYKNKVYLVRADNTCILQRFNRMNHLTHRYLQSEEEKSRYLISERSILLEHNIYGEEVKDGELNNTKGQLCKTYDQSGYTRYQAYSIHGKVQSLQKQYCSKYNEVVDWTKQIDLETECYHENMTYDNQERVVKEVMGDGSYTLFTHYQNGLLRSMGQFSEQGECKAAVEKMQYSASGKKIAESYHNGTALVQIFDSYTDRLLYKRLLSKEKTPLVNQYYSYDAHGNITRIRDNSGKVNSEYYKQQKAVDYLDYTYDVYNRIIQGIGREGANQEAPQDYSKLETYTEKYTYDEGGNITSIHHQAPTSSWTRNLQIAGEGNQLQKVDDNSVSYDVNGNLRSIAGMPQLQWDFDNRLKQAVLVEREDSESDSVFFAYDREGKRTRKVVVRKILSNRKEIRETRYLGSLQIYRVYQIDEEQNESKLILERRSIYSTAGEQGKCTWYHWLVDTYQREVTDLDTEDVHYCYEDCKQSIMLELNEKGEVITWEEFSPYGNTSFINGNAVMVARKQYRYCGKERDGETGFYYYESRYYSSYLGRMLSADEIEYLKPEEWLRYNLYTYCLNNPVNYVDEDGHWPVTNIGVRGGRVGETRFNAVAPPVVARYGGLGITALGGGGLVVNPNNIHFMQNTCGMWCRNREYSVFSNAFSLRADASYQLPPIRIWLDGGGNLWSLDHRRLASYLLAGRARIPVVWATETEVRDDRGKMDDKTEEVREGFAPGQTIYLRGRESLLTRRQRALYNATNKIYMSAA